MYEYIYTELKTEFPELTTGSVTQIYPSHAPDDSNFDDLIVFQNIGNSQVFQSKMATIQISCFSKNALRSVALSDRVRKLFMQKNATGKVLKTRVRSGVDMIYEKESKYYQSNCELLVQSTLEFV